MVSIQKSSQAWNCSALLAKSSSTGNKILGSSQCELFTIFIDLDVIIPKRSEHCYQYFVYSQFFNRYIGKFDYNIIVSWNRMQISMYCYFFKSVYIGQHIHKEEKTRPQFSKDMQGIGYERLLIIPRRGEAILKLGMFSNFSGDSLNFCSQNLQYSA